MSQPIIAWNNLLKDSTYVFNNGTEMGGFPLTNCWTWDILRPCYVTADAAGIIQITFTIPATAGAPTAYGAGGYGLYSFSRIPLDVFIFGASRHDSAGYRSNVPGVITLSIDGTTVVNSTDIWSNTASVLFKTGYGAGSTVVLYMDGFAANEIVTIPELYLGAYIEMPYIDLGYDTYNEASYGNTFQSESGREYPQLRYRRLELNPNWSNVEYAYWSNIELLRENALELRNPFWYAWNPDQFPYECYMMRNKPTTAPFKYTTQVHKSFGLQLTEVI